jgi:di/tricarboxylate transporter
MEFPNLFFDNASIGTLIDQCLLVAIIVGGAVLYMGQWLPIETTSIILLAALASTGILLPEEVFSGFANKATITVAAMFILSSALSRTGALDVLARRIAVLSRGSPLRLLVVLALVIPAASAFVNNTPIVIMMVPIVLSLCRQFDFKPSKVMIPLSFFSILGGACTLLGTSTNIVVDGLYRRYTEESAATWSGPQPLRDGFGLFDFSPVGLVCFAVGTTFLLLFSRRLLPERSSLSGMVQMERQALFVTEVIVRGEPLVGKKAGDVIQSKKLRLLELVRGEEIVLGNEAKELTLEPEDALIIEGKAQDINAFVEQPSADLASVVEDDVRVPMRTIELKLAEVVVLPDSPWETQTVSELRLNARYGVKVMAVQRHGKQHRYRIRRMRVHAGDVLLVQADDAALNALRESEAALVVEGVDRTLVSTRKAPLAVATLAGVVLLSAATGLDLAHMAIVGVALLLVTRCIRVDEAMRSLDTSVLLLLAAAIPLGIAVADTGLARVIVDVVVSVFHKAPPVVFLSAFYLLTSVLTAFLSNTAVAVLLFPIAMALAERLGMNHEALLMAICLGASASFATPIGYQTNTIVMGPGGYKFRDYLRIGLPLNILMWITASVAIPWIWPLK